MNANTFTRTVYFRRGRKDHQQLRRGRPPKPVEGRLPRVARLMALAIRYDEMLRRGDVPDMATLARQGQVTRARISQIMGLVLLAPDIQEELLFLPATGGGRDPISPRLLESLSLTPDWDRQRRQWRKIRGERLGASAPGTTTAR